MRIDNQCQWQIHVFTPTLGSSCHRSRSECETKIISPYKIHPASGQSAMSAELDIPFISNASSQPRRVDYILSVVEPTEKVIQHSTRHRFNRMTWAVIESIGWLAFPAIVLPNSRRPFLRPDAVERAQENRARPYFETCKCFISKLSSTKSKIISWRTFRIHQHETGKVQWIMNLGNRVIGQCNLLLRPRIFQDLP